MDDPNRSNLYRLSVRVSVSVLSVTVPPTMWCKSLTVAQTVILVPSARWKDMAEREPQPHVAFAGIRAICGFIAARPRNDVGADLQPRIPVIQ